MTSFKMRLLNPVPSFLRGCLCLEKSFTKRYQIRWMTYISDRDLGLVIPTQYITRTFSTWTTEWRSTCIYLLHKESIRDMISHIPPPRDCNILYVFYEHMKQVSKLRQNADSVYTTGVLSYSSGELTLFYSLRETFIRLLSLAWS